MLVHPAAALLLLHALPATQALKCSDSDTRCIERGCSSFCNKWTCEHPGCPGCGPEIGCPDKPPPPPSPPPTPSLPPWDIGVKPGELYIVASHGKLFVNGMPLYIKGVTWFGSENRAGPPLGLDRNPISWYMQFLSDNGFNAIRFLFNHDDFLTNDVLDAPDYAKYGQDAPWEAPELTQYRYTDMFVKLAQAAAEQGILIMMAAHRLDRRAWPGDGLWYDQRITEQMVMDSWSAVAARLCGQWNVFAVDLHNEPHAASWGKGDESTDWGHAAERLGNHVLSKCPRWLVMVEGVGYDPGAEGMDSGSAGIWWGENLFGAHAQPVKLSDPTKLVYSPHTYGPGTFMQKYFSDPAFPGNMAAIWDLRFGSLVNNTPIVIGELGGFYKGTDQKWQDAAIKYCVERGIGLFYFSLNPGSKDTGGLLQADYTVPEHAKLKMLGKMPTTNVGRGKI